jgi:hypothetical protein
MREDAGRVESGESEPKLRRRSSWRHFEPTPLGNEHVDWEHNPGAQQPAHHHRAGLGSQVLFARFQATASTWRTSWVATPTQLSSHLIPGHISMDWLQDLQGKFTGSSPIFNGKIYGFRLRCSLKPIHWTSEWFWVAFRHTMKLWNSMIYQPCCLLFVLLDVPSLQVDGPTRTPGPNPVLKLFWRGPGPSEIAWLVTTLSKSKDHFSTIQ